MLRDERNNLNGNASIQSVLKYIFILGLALTSEALLAQAVRPIGSVQSIENGGQKIVLKTDAGPEIQVISTETTKVVKIKPGQTSLTGAATLSLAEVAAGDRILVQGNLAEDQKSIPATRIIVMTRSELESKQASDLADWNRRGIFGVVASVDSSAGTVSVNVRSGIPGMSESKTVNVQVKESTVIRRYAPDSVKFSEAESSKLAEVKTGDQIRARGEKSPDGSSLIAEEIISGLFHNIASTVISVDPQSQTLKVTDLDTKKPILVKLNHDSVLKKMQPMMAQMMASRINQSPQASEASPTAAPPQAPPSGASRVGGGPGGLFGPRGPGNAPPNVAPGGGQIFDRLPTFSLQELKQGDALIISAPSGKNPGEITATMIVAGVEPILTSPAKDRQSILGNWNVDLSGGGMGMQ